MLSFMGRRPFVRDQILEAAFDLIARRGYEAVSTREIATAAGVGAASMFKHFPTQEDLGKALYTVALRPLQEGFRGLSGSPVEVAMAAVGLLYGFYDERPRALALLIFPPHDFTPWEVDRANPDSPRCLLQRLTRLDDDGEAVLWGAMTGPLIDRYLRRRDGAMSPLAAAHAARIRTLLPESTP
jgi:AcrR family transcriptional regulator